MYEIKSYDNLEELKQENKELVERLLEEFDEGDWSDNQLYVYQSLEDFATYEVYEGWYSGAIKEDYNGAPNLLDYIDYEALGNALKDSWDNSCYYYDEETDFVVSTAYGF
jgi:phage protein